jgi:glucose-6-phosphate 1-epimerase
MPGVAAPIVERKIQGELVILHVRTSHGQARVAEQGAQLLSYVPTGQQPLVWLSPKAAYRHGEVPRGGVPVCFPWFGDLSANPPRGACRL